MYRNLLKPTQSFVWWKKSSIARYIIVELFRLKFNTLLLYVLHTVSARGPWCSLLISEKSYGHDASVTVVMQKTPNVLYDCSRTTAGNQANNKRGKRTKSLLLFIGISSYPRTMSRYVRLSIRYLR